MCESMAEGGIAKKWGEIKDVKQKEKRWHEKKIQVEIKRMKN